jgi:DNA invertase Pin-like site-specific DNA recombinase
MKAMKAHQGRSPQVVAYLLSSSKANMQGISQAQPLAAIICQANPDEHGGNMKKISDCISGMVPLPGREEFMALLKHTDTKKIYVESASRVARSASVAEQIYQAAQATGTDTNVANNPALFKRNATPEEHFFRRIHVAIMENERDLVEHRLQMGLQAAQQKRKKVHGRKTIMEKLAPMSQQKRALKKLILQRRAGKFGSRQVLRLKQTMAMETCRRLCQQLA